MISIYTHKQAGSYCDTPGFSVEEHFSECDDRYGVEKWHPGTHCVRWCLGGPDLPDYGHGPYTKLPIDSCMKLIVKSGLVPVGEIQCGKRYIFVPCVDRDTVSAEFDKSMWQRVAAAWKRSHPLADMKHLAGEGVRACDTISPRE